MPRKSATVIRQERAAATSEAREAGVLEYLENVDNAADIKLRLACQDQPAGEGQVRYYRVVEEGRKADVYLGRMSPAEYLEEGLDRIGAAWGTGDYRIRVYDRDFKLVGNQRVPIEVHVIPPAPAAPAVDLSPLERLLAQQTEAMARQSDAVGKLITILPLMLSQRGDGDSRANWLREMVELHSILQPVQTQPPIDVIALLTKGMELGKFAQGGDGESGGVGNVLLELAREFMPHIGELVKQMPAVLTVPRPVANPGAARTLAAPAPGSTPAAPAKPSAAPDARVLSAHLGVLVAAAQANIPVDEIANNILDQVGDAQAVEFLSRADWFAQLAALDAGVAPQREWFERCRLAVLEMAEQSAPAGLIHGTHVPGEPLNARHA